MKIIKIMLISFVVLLLVLSVAAVIFVKTFDINRFKPQIISKLNKALNRQVDFEKAGLGISLRRGINLKISNLVIADDPAFGKGDFLTVKNISLAVDALKYIFKKEVNVPNVLIDTPRLKLIRKKDGSLNVQTLAQPGKSGKESPKPALAQEPLALPAILIASIRGGNGTVMFSDQTFEPPLRLEISDLNFSLSEISLTKDFPFAIEAAVLSAKKNIRIKGKARIDLKTNSVTISGLKGSTDLSQLLLDKIPVSFPMTKGAILPVSLKGKADAVLERLTVGSQGLVALTGDAVLTDAELRFKEIYTPVRNIRMDIKATQTKILLDNLSATIGEGLIKGSGSISDYLAKQDFAIAAQVKDLKIQDLIDQNKSPVKAEGIASGQIKVKGQGFSAEALQSSLSGKADISVTKAKLKDLNVLRVILDKISVIPRLAQKMEDNLPERYKQKLANKDTILSDIKLPITIENGRFLLKGIVFGADEFLFKGWGESGFDGSYSLEGSFLIPGELSAAMVAAVGELQYLLNDQKQIYIPLKILGKAGEIKFNVDAEYIAQQLLVNQARQQLFRVFDKAIGTKEQTPSQTGQNATATQQNAPEDESKKQSTAEDLVDSIIGIFKK